MALLKFSKKKIKKAKIKSRVKRTAARKAKKKTPKKKTAKRIAVKKKATKKKVELILPGEQLIGEATHYFPKVRAAVVKLTAGEMCLGDKIHIKGHTTDFTQRVKSIQIEHTPIEKAKKGEEIGLGVDFRVRRHDKIYLLQR